MSIRKLLLLILAMFALNSVRAQEEEEEEAMSEKLQQYIADMESSMGSVDGLRCAFLAYNQAKQENNVTNQDYALQCILSSYHAMSQYERTIEFADSLLEADSLQIYALGNYNFVMYMKIVAYIELGKYRTAIKIAQELYDESYNIGDEQTYEVKRDNFKISCNSLICIGLANSEMDLYDAAIESYTRCIELINSSPYRDEILSMLVEAETYRMQTALKLSDKQRALNYLDSYSQELDNVDEVKVGTEFENLFLEDYRLLMHIGYAEVYCDMKQAGKAYEHISAAESMIDEYGDFVDQYHAELNDVRAKYYNLIGDFESALISVENALSYYADNAKSKSEVKSLMYKFEALNKAQRFSELYSIATRIFSLSDTLSNQRLKSSLDEMQAMMDVDKFKSDARELEAQRQVLETQRQMWIMVSLMVLALAFAGFALMKRRRDKERQRILSEQKKLLEEEVERQTHELREQRDEIEQKNRDITDSINYAQRIQKSILPDMTYFGQQGVTGAFAFFIPCHIVSGDFYWAYKRDNLLFFACADCTGHGVPGAFMSMIGTTILNDLCKRPEAPSPSEMLELLHINLLAVLQQSGEEDSRDGMDIAIMMYDIATHKVVVSGARRPVYIYRGEERIEYKAAKRSIGERDYTRETLPFTQEEYQLSEGDTVYMCSDGLPDQFGGPTPNGKRLLSGGLKRMLDKIVALPIEEQQTEIEKLYWEWRNDKEQLDDISLVGVRV